MTHTNKDKTYIISRDEYMGLGQDMHSFRGGWRSLLLHLNGSEETDYVNDGEVIRLPGGHEVTYVSDMTDGELLTAFNDANGDGQPYVMVFCVEDDKKVLG